jgi:hypothetical protein
MIRIARIHARRTYVSALAALSLLAISGSGMAQAADAPVVGGACETLGARAEGTSLDCVTTGTTQTWQLKGTRPNPYRIGETAQLQRYVGAKYIPGYTLKLTAGNPDASADVTVSAGAIKKNVIPAGWKPVTAGIQLTLVGRQPAPSAGLYMKFVDSANKEYSLYNYKKGDLSCTGGGVAKQVNAAPLTKNTGTITGNVCSFVNPASINSTLLLRVQVRATKAGQPLETWYSFL